jgi:tRNA 2-thiouridine synthesizing protein A
MPEEIDPDISLDLKGLACPVPMVKVNENISKIKEGKILKAVTSDPGSLADLPSWAKSTGNKIIRIDKGKKQFTFYIKRTA